MRDQVVFSAEGRINTKKERARDCKNSLDTAKTPASYKSNSTREDLCLEYIQSFLRQYEKVYPTRKLPYIMVDNEHGLQKFICSFIRPTQNSISELYDMYECSAFLAGYILYEPLDPVMKPPQIIFSPTETLKRHTGDCFDISTLLCSLLIGSGYDAYVVCGSAPRHITLRDQSSTLFPMSNNQNEILAKSKIKSVEEESLYIPVDDSTRTSEFLAHQEEQRRLEMLDKFELWVNDPPPPPLLTGSQKEITDDLVYGARRQHAWVMILAGKRDVKENCFFESSTGRAYPTSSSPYTEIESIWNSTNFWVLNRTDTKLTDMNFDLSRSDIWESLFPFGARINRDKVINTVTTDAINGVTILSSSSISNSNSSSSSSSGSNSGKEGSSSSSAVVCEEPMRRIFESPPSWVAPIMLDRANYLIRYPPLGRRTVQYYCTNVDFYASNTHPQCMVMRITTYLNKERTIVKEINEWFENRKDKMFKRVRIVLGGVNRFIESYHPGGAGEIKQWTQYPGKTVEVDYHVSGRLDRLVRRVETVGEKIVEHFAGRTDNLIYRSVHFTTDSNLVGTRQFLLGGVALVPPLYIMKMTQKYEVNKTLPATESSLAKRIFYVKEGKAVATYHFKDGEITSQVKTYFYSKGVGVSSMSKQAYLQELGVVEDSVLLQEVALLERECYSSAKLVYQQILSIDSVRAESEKKIINEKNIFEIALEKADKLDIAQQGMISEGGVETGPKGLNYLTPYLRKFKNKEFSELTKEEAIEIRQNCLDALRSRLVERSNIIQSRLNDENSKLGLQQAIFQRTHTERNEELLPTETKTKTKTGRERERETEVEEYQKNCTEAMFRIQILEQRLSTHEGAALKKFAELDARLAADERLRVLWPTTSMI